MGLGEIQELKAHALRDPAFERKLYRVKKHLAGTMPSSEIKPYFTGASAIPPDKDHPLDGVLDVDTLAGLLQQSTPIAVAPVDLSNQTQPYPAYSPAAFGLMLIRSPERVSISWDH